MADKIRVNYPEVKAMADHCEKMGDKVMQVKWAVEDFAKELPDGQLVGEPGDALAKALLDLAKGTGQLCLKIFEIQKDVENAIKDMESADKKAGATF